MGLAGCPGADGRNAVLLRRPQQVSDGRARSDLLHGFLLPEASGDAYYLMSTRDKNDRPFNGRGTYRLTVPPNVPVKQYWSATTYDRGTHGLIRDMPRASRSSQIPDLQKNADGSVDVFFGPRAPDGKESNWVPTSPKGEFEVLFRFYGPEKSLFEKKWKLPDIEKVG